MPNNVNLLINPGIVITGIVGGIGSAVFVFFNTDRSSSFFALSVVCAFVGGVIGVSGFALIINNILANTIFRRNDVDDAVRDDFVVGRPYIIDNPIRPTSVDNLGRISQLCLKLEDLAKESELEKAIDDIRVLINKNHNANYNIIDFSSDKFLTIADVKLLTNDPPTENLQAIIIEKLPDFLPQDVVVKDATIDFLLDAMKRHNDLSFDGGSEDDQVKTKKAIEKFIEGIKNNKPYESPWELPIVILIQDSHSPSNLTPNTTIASARLNQPPPQSLGVGFN